MLYSALYYELKYAFDKVSSWCTLSVKPGKKMTEQFVCMKAEFA